MPKLPCVCQRTRDEARNARTTTCQTNRPLLGHQSETELWAQLQPTSRRDPASARLSVSSKSRDSASSSERSRWAMPMLRTAI